MQKYIKPEFYITEFETDDTGKTNSCQYVDANRRSAAGETVLIPADKQKKHRNGIVTFSKTGEFLWEQLSRRQTERSLVHLLAAECGKDEKEIKADVDEFIEKAVEENLITYCDAEL